MARFNCISSHVMSRTGFSLLQTRFLSGHRLWTPTFESMERKSKKKTSKYLLDFFHGRHCVSLCSSQPTSLLLSLCLFQTPCLLIYFRSCSLKTELLCQNIAVFCNVTGPNCQKPAEINHKSVLFTTGCECVCVRLNTEQECAQCDIIERSSEFLCFVVLSSVLNCDVTCLFISSSKQQSENVNMPFIS